MSWLRELVVTGGRMWFKPAAEENRYTVEGLLECVGPFKVWFQDIDRAIAFADPESSAGYEVLEGHCALESRLDPGIPQPSDLFELWQRLLSPQADEGEGWYGYVFSAKLPLAMGETLAVRFKDTTYWGRNGTFMELARFEEPYALVAHERYRVFGVPREEFDVILRLKSGWPLQEE